MTEIVAIQGMQWGSEAKGSIALVTALGWQPDAVVAAWHPNAGHTAHMNDKKYVHSMLPIGALSPSVKTILIGPGAVVDLHKLQTELAYAADHVRGKHVIIHSNAALLQTTDADEEKDLVRIGSTMKGSMIAAIRKMRRGPQATIGQVLLRHDLITVSGSAYDSAVDNSNKLLVEGAQGYGLGIHTPFYPYCTSRDVSTAQLLADCRIPWSDDIRTIGVCRTYPIRVANRYDDKGERIGWSGDTHPFQRELNWQEDLHREPELTTVTKLPRRIFDFSLEQVWEAARIMRPSCIALTFCDYLLSMDDNLCLNGQGRANLPQPVKQLAGSIRTHINVPVRLFSFGPTVRDVWQRDFDDSLWPLTRPYLAEEPFNGQS